MNDEQFMNIAILEAYEGVGKKEGGPFGAVIVKDNKIVSFGHNMVLQTNDPTMHAEIVAIRKACSKLGRFDLSDCTIYSTCEPCPMCYSAIHWAKIKKLYYGCTKKDAADIGFDDNKIYEAIINNKSEQVISEQISREECLIIFTKWDNPKKQLY